MPTNNISLEEIIQRLEKLEIIEHKNILELPQVPAINMTDTLMLVTETDLTGKASVEAFMQYLNENDLWSRVGQAYMIIGAKDDYQSKIKNLQNSVLLYNPNNVPIRVKFMVFS